MPFVYQNTSNVRPATPEDSPAIAEIYNHYILHSIATFEETPISADEMQSRIQSVMEKIPWLVYENEREILGYAYATQWKPRSAYRHSVEITVYTKRGASQKGIGTALYTKLIEMLKTMKIHAIMGGVSLPNEASIALHEKFGFQKVAHFREVGYKFNKWIDVGYWELVITPSTEAVRRRSS